MSHKSCDGARFQCHTAGGCEILVDTQLLNPGVRRRGPACWPCPWRSFVRNEFRFLEFRWLLPLPHALSEADRRDPPLLNSQRAEPRRGPPCMPRQHQAKPCRSDTSSCKVGLSAPAPVSPHVSYHESVVRKRFSTTAPPCRIRDSFGVVWKKQNKKKTRDEASPSTTQRPHPRPLS